MPVCESAKVCKSPWKLLHWHCKVCTTSFLVTFWRPTPMLLAHILTSDIRCSFAIPKWKDLGKQLRPELHLGRALHSPPIKSFWNSGVCHQPSHDSSFEHHSIWGWASLTMSRLLTHLTFNRPKWKFSKMPARLDGNPKIFKTSVGQLTSNLALSSQMDHHVTFLSLPAGGRQNMAELQATWKTRMKRTSALHTPDPKGIVALHGRQHEKIAPVLLSFLTQAVTALVQHDASWGEYAAQHLEGLSSAFGGCPRRVPAISRQWHMWFIMIDRTHCPQARPSKCPTNLFSLLLKLPQLIKIDDCHFRFFWLLTIVFLIVVIENQLENRMVK